MARKNLEEAMSWILANGENTKAFRADFDVITKKFTNLDAEDLKVLRAVHQKGDKAPELAESRTADVVGQEAGGHSTRSHGW